MRYSNILAISILFFIPATGFSATIIVPDDYPTIQQAIDAAANGDTVLVKPGTYIENIDFIGKAIKVTSEQGIDVTILDGNQAGSVVTCKNGEGLNSVLDGFTITNGSGTSSPPYGECGGGMFNYSSSPTVINCTFSGNMAMYGGGMFGGNPTNCTFSGNSGLVGGGMFEGNPSNCTFIGNSGLSGGGICGGNPTNCIFSGNSAISGGGMNGGNPTNCIFFANSASTSGGGMFNEKSNSTVTNCTFAGNWAKWRGGGMNYTSKSIATVTNTVSWNNDAPLGPEIYIGTSSNQSTLTISYSDLKGGKASIYVDPGCTLNWGPGMIDADPLFVTGPCSFYYLSQIAAGQPSDSPCVDTGAGPASNYGMDIYWTRTDGVPDSGVVDMGFHYGDFYFPALQTNNCMISEASGGFVDFFLLAGPGYANRDYILLGSVNGTDPGTPLPGGSATLPLNWDIFTNLVVKLINTPVFSNFMGQLDGMGSAMAAFDTLAPIPGLAGLTMHFAYALNAPWDFASNTVRIKIMP